jgi:hypothetical protein
MMKYTLPFLLILSACGDSIEPVKVEGSAKKPFEQNATDAAGVAQGDEQVSPYGKPAY